MELIIKIWGLKSFLKEAENPFHITEWFYRLHFSGCLLSDIFLIIVKDLP